MKRTVLMLLVGTLISAVIVEPDIAWAQDSVVTQVEELSKMGAAAYKDKDYDAALAYFEQAYNLEPAANLLYNIAKCHEKNDNLEKALEFYEKFALAPEAEKDAREAALKKSIQMRDRIEIRDANERDKSRRIQAQVHEDADKNPFKTPGYLSLGAGAVGVTVGVLGHVRLATQKSEAEALYGGRDKIDPDELEDVMRRQSAMNRSYNQMWIGYSIGAVSVLSGSVLLYLSGNHESNNPKTLTVIPTRHGGVVGVSSRF